MTREVVREVAGEYNCGMEELINSLPKWIDNFEGQRFYLTIGSGDMGWVASYVDYRGNGNVALTGQGEGPVEALKDLHANFHVVHLVNAPTVLAEEDLRSQK